MKKYIANITFAAALMVVVNAQADFVTVYNASERDEYNKAAGASEWALVGAAEFDKTKAPYNDFLYPFTAFCLTFRHLLVANSAAKVHATPNKVTPVKMSSHSY